MLYVIWSAQVFPGWGTLALYLFGAVLLLAFSMLYWPQLVLFQQSNKNRLLNIVLFTIKYFWRVIGVAALHLAYLLAYLLFAPWTLILVPFLGLWFIVFLSEFLLYDQLNDALNIEEKFFELEGDPWRDRN